MNDPILNKLLSSFDRPLSEVAYKVLEAQSLLKAQKYQEALAALSKLDALADKTPDETYVIERTRVAAAYAAGNQEMLVKSAEAVIATGQLDKADRINFIEVLANSYYRQKNYPQAVSWLTRYFKEGGNDATMRTMLAKSYYFTNDFAHAAQEARTGIEAEEAAAKIPSEDQLRLLLSSMRKLNDAAGYDDAMEKFVAYYPKKENWTNLLNHVSSKPGFSDYLSFDVYRLMLATGQLNTADDLTRMAQVALHAGYPAEARKIVEQGFQSGLLGVGAEAAAHRTLLELVTKATSDELKNRAKDETTLAAAKTGDSMVSLGYTYVVSGQSDKGLGLMEQGIQIGKLKRPEDAKLHLAIAYLLADRKDQAIRTFKTVKGSDGSADLARYWVMYLSRPGQQSNASTTSPG